MNKVYTIKQAIEKAQQYCAYQERCHQDVRSKLFEMGFTGDDAELIIADLIEHNFLNEERFARSFTRGRFRIKRWGKIKIRKELESRRISAYCIDLALREEIENRAYQVTFDKVFDTKWRMMNHSKDRTALNKVARFMMSRGYESNLIWDKINQVKKNG